MGTHVLGKPINPGIAWPLRLMEVLLSAPVVLWAAVPYYRRGWLGVVHRTPKHTIDARWKEGATVTWPLGRELDYRK